MPDIVIIGGGLAGLALAQHLHQAGRSYALYEARNRFGGRILSVANTAGPAARETFRNDLGPSWIWPDHQPRIAAFTAAHGLASFPQWQTGRSLYQADRHLETQPFIDTTVYASARRVVGDSYRLIETLLAQLPPDCLNLEHRLLALSDRGDHIALHFESTGSSLALNARQVVLTIPPRLLAERISFDPPLDTRMQRLMHATPTWMAGHAKAAIRYPEAFWRAADYSGSVLANYPGAALAEIFDACSEHGEQAALAGFFALPASLRRRYRNDLESLIVEQLVRLFGEAAAKPEAVLIQDWFTEPCTAASADETPPQEHPQYGHRWLQLDHWNDKLFFGGTETAADHGGYLEGALVAAERVAQALST